MNRKVNLIYKLEGPKIDEGIDIFELSPMLLSIGQLIQESNEILYPGNEKLAVNVRPFKKGSFVVEIILFAKTNLQQLINYCNLDDIKRIKELAEWLGIIGGGGIGVIQIYKFLKGPPKKFEEKPEEVKIIGKDDKSLTVNKKVFSLYQNNKIQQSVYNIYGNFLSKDGINSVKSYLKDNEKEEVKVSKEEVVYFNPANTIPQEDSDNQKRNITRCFLKPKRLSVEGEPDNWSFRKGGETIITATIKDIQFLDKVKTGEIRLSKEDLLEVDLLEIQIIKNQEIMTRYELIKVVKYKKSPTQPSLLT